MKVNRYYPLAFVYFFVNSLGLPFGLLYTILCTPFLYAWLLIKGKKQIIIKFLIFSSPFIIIQWINGVDEFTFVKSILLFITVYIFCYSFYVFLRTCNDIEGIFKNILVTNFILTIIALLFLKTELRNWFWNDWSISTSGIAVTDWPRLMMFTYEPSYYSTLLAPIFAFYFLGFVFQQAGRKDLLSLTMIALPLILSFSMGVILGLIFSTIILFLFNFSKVITKKKLFYAATAITIVVVVTIVGLFFFYPDNPFFVRIIAILAGDDGSAKGRTYQAFQLGYIIAEEKSIWWGVGFGQLKIIGDPIIKAFYNYPPSYGQVSIPCSAAETLALFGLVGFILRFLIEIYLFFKTKVLNNTYRTFLFFYIFIYQFTGGFTTNIAEYVIWILAFTNCFPRFNKDRMKLRADVELSSNPLQK